MFRVHYLLTMIKSFRVEFELSQGLVQYSSVYNVRNKSALTISKIKAVVVL